MRCLDCAVTGLVAEASATCVDCGAGLCRNHLVLGHREREVRASEGFETGMDERWSRAARCRECARTCSGQEAVPWPAPQETGSQ
ncbi:DUF2180 family protein [Amycolatopsis mongoliensis]|uniref:DUF2180 family protein n=1 Tax=Amycolatopsis mongoliensis TaxID=715475 RepID=A0A9Y2NJX1_9PSEU|nr:DUF2180 family protein [Amycolatopsis sp. 4-36]WIY00525.1 DUF2180 family protein [Amycolatopsis sp. 4-36]